MKEVKKVFFMDKEEAINIAANSQFISETLATNYPVFELKDGTIMYPHYGCPSGGEVWYQTINKK